MAEPARLAIKIDVDTDRGTREGLAPLARALDRHKIRGTFLFSLGPDNTGRAIRRVFRPGFFAKVRIPGSGEYEALLIRDSAVGDDQGSSFVWVIDAENKAVYRPITLGPLLEGMRIVRSGLKVDEKVVVLGLMSVRNGVTVKPAQVEMEPKPATTKSKP